VNVKNNKREANQNNEFLSDYIAVFVDPVFIEKDNLIRLGCDPETITF
jgi:hypothetical protein